MSASATESGNIVVRSLNYSRKSNITIGSRKKNTVTTFEGITILRMGK